MICSHKLHIRGSGTCPLDRFVWDGMRNDPQRVTSERIIYAVNVLWHPTDDITTFLPVLQRDGPCNCDRGAVPCSG